MISVLSLNLRFGWRASPCTGSPHRNPSFCPPGAGFVHAGQDCHSAHLFQDALLHYAHLGTQSANNFVSVLNEASLRTTLNQLKKEGEVRLWLKGTEGKPDEGPPTIVFGVNSNDSASQVQDRLLWSKDAQHERRLASIVIDISQTRVALNLEIGLQELRTSLFNVPLTSKEAKGMLGLMTMQNMQAQTLGVCPCTFRRQMRGGAQNFASAVKRNVQAEVLFQRMVEGSDISLVELASALRVNQPSAGYRSRQNGASYLAN